MSHLFTLIKKELRELLTPATVLPIVLLALIFASMGGLTGNLEESVAAEPEVAIVNLDEGGNYSALFMDVVQQANATVVLYGNQSDDVGDAVAAVKDNGSMAALVIGPDHSSSIEKGEHGNITVYWNMKGTGLMNSVSTAPVELLLAVVERETTHALIQSMIDDGQLDDREPGNITAPISYSSNTLLGDMVMEDIRPEQVSSFMMTQNFLMPLLIMIVIVMLGGIIISSMGQEKENKTLETLLTLPVNRTTIVSGKLLGSAIVGLLFAGIYMMGMSYYMDGLTATAPVDMSEYGMELGTLDLAIVGAMMVLAILCALGLCMIFGAFAKNYKVAQSLTIPISFLAVIPFFVVMFADFKSLPALVQAVLFIIPFTHPMIAMDNLMMGHMGLIFSGMAYQALFTLATIMVTVRLYKSDILLTGLGTTLRSGPLGKLLRLR